MVELRRHIISADLISADQGSHVFRHYSERGHAQLWDCYSTTPPSEEGKKRIYKKKKKNSCLKDSGQL